MKAHTPLLSKCAPPPQTHPNILFLADNGTGDELLHDLIGTAVDGLDARVNKRPGNTSRQAEHLAGRQPSHRSLYPHLAMGYSHM